MSETDKDSLINCLFPGHEKKRLRNVKFFRGTRDIITQAELCAEAHSAIMQKRANPDARSTEAPRSKQQVVDVRAFVADM